MTPLIKTVIPLLLTILRFLLIKYDRNNVLKNRHTSWISRNLFRDKTGVSPGVQPPTKGYIAKQATAAVVYGVVTAGSLQAIPQTIGVLGSTDTTNQSKYGSTIWNIGSQIGPTIAGGYVGAISDVVQFVQTVGNSITKPQTSPNQSSGNTSQKNIKVIKRISNI